MSENESIPGNATSLDQPVSSPTADAPQWFIDEKTPGAGMRPEWMPAKYQRLSDVEKARAELEKKLGGFTGAPESYDVASLELDDKDPTIQALMDVGKKYNMNQDAFAEMVGRLSSVQETQEQMHIEDQVKQLGPDGQRQLTEFKNWTKDYLKAEEQEVVTQWVKTADDLKAFNRIMAHTHMSQVPTTATMNMANNFEGVQDLRAELTKNIAKFNSDKAYAKDWSNRMSRAVTRNPNS